jgi:hypothetical protein
LRALILTGGLVAIGLLISGVLREPPHEAGRRRIPATPAGGSAGTGGAA